MKNLQTFSFLFKRNKIPIYRSDAKLDPAPFLIRIQIRIKMTWIVRINEFLNPVNVTKYRRKRIGRGKLSKKKVIEQGRKIINLKEQI